MRRILTASIMSVVTVLGGFALAAQPASAGPICKHVRYEILRSGHAMCRDGVENIIWSADQHYVLKMQSNGDIVLYQLAVPGDQSTGTAVWALTYGTDGAFVVMERFGWFVYKNADGSTLAGGSIATPPVEGSWLKVQNDGKLVIYTPNNVAKQQSCYNATIDRYTWCIA